MMSPESQFTVRLKVVDPQQAEAFLRAMRDGSLISGCEVRAFSYSDVFAERDRAQRAARSQGDEEE